MAPFFSIGVPGGTMRTPQFESREAAQTAERRPEGVKNLRPRKF